MTALKTAKTRHQPAVAGTREFIAIVACCMAMAAMSIDFLLPAFPKIREEFGLEPGSTQVAQLITAFFLGLALGQVFYGPLSDRFGRKRLLYAGLVIYAIAAASATLTTTLSATVALRFVWGFGAAAPRSLALAMVRDSYEGDRMARAMSQVMTVFILVPVFAPVLGALAVALGPWRIVFWIPVLGSGALALWLTRLPETLPEERRRSVSPRALIDALGAVVKTRETMAYGIAVTLLFAIMTSFIGGAQTIFERVYDAKDLFPVLFGAIACMLGVGSLLSGRLVVRFGLLRLVRGASFYLVGAAAIFAALAAGTDGRPPMWAFCVSLGVLLPGVMVLVPCCNTAAMTPVPHVAGMASAVLGTISTGGGALLGSVVDSLFDDTVRPFAFAGLIYAVIAAFAILVLARVPEREMEEVIVVAEPAA